MTRHPGLTVFGLEVEAGGSASRAFNLWSFIVLNRPPPVVRKKMAIKRLSTYCRQSAILCILGLLCACAAPADMVSETPDPGENFSSAQIREFTVDQPFMLSGDYFREKSYNRTLDLREIVSSGKKLETEQEDLKSRVAMLEKELAEKRGNFGPGTIPVSALQPDEVLHPFQVKVGLLIDRKKVSPLHAGLLKRAARDAAEQVPVIFIPPGEVVEALSGTDCIHKKDLACVSRALGLYPGVRILILVEGFIVPEQAPGTLSLKLSMADTGLVFRYPGKEIDVPLKREADLAGMVQKIFTALFYEAAGKGRVMPWFCRTFSREKDLWYVNAGRESGLKPGDILDVVPGGKLVKAPTGVPAGWLPGNKKGVVRVERIFGRDAAACSLVEGRGPEPEDILVKGDRPGGPEESGSFPRHSPVHAKE